MGFCSLIYHEPLIQRCQLGYIIFGCLSQNDLHGGLPPDVKRKLSGCQKVRLHKVYEFSQKLSA